MKTYQDTKYIERGTKDKPVIFWAHGWGQSHNGFDALSAPLENMGKHILVDFPGFGESPLPPDSWSTEDYADHIAGLIKEKSEGPVIWVGHSFGCRVGLQLASRHPELIMGLCLIAGAGLKRKRPLLKKLYFKGRIAVYKVLKKIVPLVGISEDQLRAKFGSADYNNADPKLRQILIKVVNEDLSDVASKVSCPTYLIYGENDTETPPEFGHKLSGLIQSSKLVLLEGQDHYSVLSQGRHQVLPHLKDFIVELS